VRANFARFDPLTSKHEYRVKTTTDALRSVARGCEFMKCCG
jgi:hypothetical protein